MKTKFKPILIGWLLLLTLLTGAACTMIVDAAAGQTPQTFFGESGEMGQGTARTFAELDADGSPVRIGIVFTPGLLEGLPTELNTNDERRCFDKNGDDAIHAHDECVGDYELALSLPLELALRTDIPFLWASVNWNPLGHLPPAKPVWAVPHFDFHFYTLNEEAVQAIRPGTCGHLMDCADFEHAQTPVPAPYLPTNYKMSAAVPAMGQHMIDPTAPELADPPQTEFIHSFLYGAYDGHIIFYEPMIAHDFLVNQPDECKAFPLPEAWETSGYYPTEYCIRYQEGRGEYTVSLEGFVYRETEKITSAVSTTVEMSVAPTCAAFDRYFDLYTQIVHRKGGDPNIGPKLVGMFLQAGLAGVEVQIVQPVHREGELKRIAQVTLERISEAVTAAGLASAEEVSATVAELAEYTARPDTIISHPRVFQVWGVRESP